MGINFFFNDTTIRLNQRRLLKLFVDQIFKNEGKELDTLTYVFCTDSYLLNINRNFLKHDDYTDIITFTLSLPKQPIIGEVYISVDRVKENAVSLNIESSVELHRVIFHGALHLCGYNDKKISDKKLMTKMEDKYLSLYFNVPRGTRE